MLRLPPRWAVSRKDKKADPEDLVPRETTGSIDDFATHIVDDTPVPEGVDEIRHFMDGAVVAHAMELRKELGMPYIEPQQAVEEMGMPWDKVQILLPYWKSLVWQLNRKPGRPKKTVDDRWSHPGTEAVMIAIREYMFDNPGCVQLGPTRQRKVYSDDYRGFVLSLLGSGGPGQGMTAAQAQAATGISPSTLAAWRGQRGPKRRRK